MENDIERHAEKRTKAATFWVDKNQIYHAVYHPMEHVGRIESEDEMDHCASMSSELPALSVVDISEVKSVFSESRELYSSDRAMGLYRAVALITRTPLSRVIGNFFLGINRPPMPVRLFDDIESAKKWLSSLRI